MTTAIMAKRQNLSKLLISNARVEKPPPRQHLPKSDLRYWRTRVKCPIYIQNGERFSSPHFSVCVSYQGQRKNLSLQTGNRDEAAKAALKLWQDVRQYGWQVALANLRPVETLPSDTVGDLISAVEKGTAKTPTREAYIRNFRLLAAEVMNIKRSGNKLAAIGKWKARVAKVKLASLTPEKIEQFKLRRIEAAAGDVMSQHSAKISVNTLIRFSKSLFSPRVLKQLGLESVANPFKEIGYLKASPKKYAPTFEVKKLFAAAETELKGDELKVFLLAICCGLRRHEIDYLEYPSFDWQKNLIVIRETKYFQAKTDDSHGVIPVDPELMKRFYGFYVEHEKAMEAKKEQKRNDFVIQSVFAKPRLEKRYIRYRCAFAFQGLTKWLRTHGVTGPRPLHQLRKESISIVNAAHGIFVASRFARHSSIAITAAVYSDNRGLSGIRLADLIGA
jgi:integrase